MIAPGKGAPMNKKMWLWLALTLAPVAAEERISRLLPPECGPTDLPPTLTLDPAHSPPLSPPSGRLPVHFRLTPGGMRARVEVGPADLYGGGEVTGPLRRNGTRVELWNRDNYQYKDLQGRALYQSHPWAMGVRPDGSAFGVLFDTTFRSTLVMRDGIIELQSQAPAFPCYLIEGTNPQEVVRALGRLTGRIPLPPRWALGYHQCRYSYAPDREVREVAGEFRRRHIPCDVIWMDIDYMREYRVFTFDPQGFPDPARLNQDLHDQGFHSIWMIDPGVKKDPGYAVYDSGSQQDVWVKDAQGQPFVGKVWPGECVFPDFTQPRVRRWWGELYRPFLALGVDGVWNDMNEPALFGVPSKTMPEDNRHEGGEELPPGIHRQYHNVYGMLMVRATREGIETARPERRPFVLTRSNFLGGQRYAATWTGDNSSRQEDLRQSVPMSLTLSLSGQPFNGPDLGGFAEDATPTLWGQWIGSGAYFPFCRGHGSKDANRKEPWAFGPEVEKTARRALQKRYRLLPYLYTLFERSSRTGDPIMQPVFFADPPNADLRREQQAFLLGQDLLVVPAWAVRPHLPGGVWPELKLLPGQEDAFQARLYQRPGSILPLGVMVENTQQDSLACLTLSLAPDASGRAEGELYWDAGEGLGYRQGDYRLSHFQARHGRVEETDHQGSRAPDWRRLVVQSPQTAFPPP